MRVLRLLRDAPDIALRVGFGREAELRLGDQIDDFVGGQKITGIKIDAAKSLPDDDLPNRKLIYDVRSVLQQAALDAPFVIVKDGAPS